MSIIVWLFQLKQAEKSAAHALQLPISLSR